VHSSLNEYNYFFLQIQYKVQREVLRSVTTYHRDSLYVKLDAIEASLNNSLEFALKHEPEKFVTELIEDSRAMLKQQEWILEIFVSAEKFSDKLFLNKFHQKPTDKQRIWQI
jgi:hypothetical protein